jgi:hypothetical protein
MFAWRRLADADWYAVSASTLWGEEVVTAIVKGTDVCDGETCSMPSPRSLEPGTHRWKVQAGNVFGYGPWNALTIFRVGENAAPVVTGRTIEATGGLLLIAAASDPDIPITCHWRYDSARVSGSNVVDAPPGGGQGAMLARLLPGTDHEAVTHSCTDYWGATGSTRFDLRQDPDRSR